MAVLRVRKALQNFSASSQPPQNVGEDGLVSPSVPSGSSGVTSPGTL